MEKLNKIKMITLAAGLSILLLTFIWGNSTSITSGFPFAGYISSANAEPPPWAPAHGYRAKHQYRYYPASHIYYDTARKLYFYLEGENWRFGVSLPVGIKLDVTDHVVLEMDTDKPYEFHTDVVKQYPGGKLKKKDKSKEEQKDKGKNKEKGKGKK